MTTDKKWLVKGDEVGYISDHDDQSFGMFCPVAVVYDEKYARLIAAAPELLEALSAILLDAEDAEAFSRQKGQYDIAAQRKGRINAARAAIAKATGVDHDH